jgi:lipopolysaccharide/colanic/teichoic acid biosynthesis glycosyltransferase
MIRRAARPVLYVGTVAAVLGLAKIHARYIGHYVLHQTQPSRLVWTIAYIGILGLASYGTGLPDLPRTRRQAVTSSIGAPLAAAVTVSLIQLIAGDALLPRFVVFGAAVVLVPWNLACVALAHSGRVQGERRDRVALVASDAEATALRDELETAAERPAALVAAMRPADALPVGHLSKPLCERVIDARATVVVLDRTALAEPAIVSQAASLHEAGLRVRTLRLFYSDWLGKLPVSELERSSLLFDIRELHGLRYLRMKRLMDVALATVGVIVVAVLTPLVAVGDLIANRGPLLYRQPRIGKNGRTFEILKFRTMKPVGPDTLANEWTAENDPRITPFGRLLRKTHIDELPQVINILRGDLSVVGPRPEQPHYVEELTQKLPFYNLRHLVRPGLTGWAQVNYGYAGDERDALEKLQFEFWYLEHQTLALDARIIGRTVRSILGSRGTGR